MASYPKYLASLEEVMAAPAAMDRERARVEAEFEAAQRSAAGSLEAPQHLAAYVGQRANFYISEARELLKFAGLASLAPGQIRPVAVAGPSTPTDVSEAETAVHEAAEVLRLAVLRHRQSERDAAEELRRALEAAETRRLAEEADRLRAERMASARATRRRRMLRALGATFLFLLTVLAIVMLR